MLRRACLASVLLLLLAVAGAAAALVPGDYDRTLEFEGRARRYLLHVPPHYDGTRPVPLVLNFHGFLSNADQQRAISGWVPVSDREGFLLVHPQSVGVAWNAGTCCGNRDVDDVAFVRALVTAIKHEAKIDHRRVYATGLSNGGGMTQVLACEAADVFAAAAPMAFPIPFLQLPQCRPSRAIPVLTFMGLVDVLVPYNGGPFGSAATTFAYWRDLDGCRASQPDLVTTQGNSRCETFTHCARHGEAGLCSITAQTFGGSSFDGHILYFNDDLNLAEVAWTFLQRFKLPRPQTSVQSTVSGTQTLTVGGTPQQTQVEWQLTLGPDTWTATTSDGAVLTGSREGRHRLVLATASRMGLAAVYALHLALTEESVDNLQVLVRGKHVRVIGQVQLADQGTLRVRLAGRVSAP